MDDDLNVLRLMNNDKTPHPQVLMGYQKFMVISRAILSR